MLFKYTREGDIGVIILTGEKGYTEAKDAWEQIMQIIQQDNPRAVLVHDNSINRISVVDVMSLERFLQDINLTRKHKIAIIDADERQNGINEFGETVVINRGWCNIRVFHEETQAREWLE
jgi:hypothetical protein